MLQNESVVVVADNSWAKKAKIIRIIKSSTAKKAKIWDKVVVAIQEATPAWSVKKWQVVRAIIVRTRKETRRADWSYIRFGDNAIVLLTKDAKWELSPIWKRVFGPVARELKDLWYKNITNMAEEVL
jgi:large subunit ribosomal protein L14